MSLKQKFYAKIAGIVLASLTALGFGTGTLHLGGIDNATSKFSDIGSTGTSTSYLLAANTSTQVLATSSARIYARISNVGSTAIYCNANGDKAAVAYSGIMIAASSSLALAEDFPFTGAVRCISPLGTASTTVYSRF